MFRKVESPSSAKRRLGAVMLVCFCVLGLAPVGYAQTDRVSQLIGKLKAKDARTRERAAGALAKIGPPAVEPLIAALKDRDLLYPQSAEWALGRIGAPAVEPLIAALKDADWRVKTRAADALGETKDPRAVEPLVAALKDTRHGFQYSAVEALGKIKDPRAVEPLIALLKARDMGVQALALQALGRIGPPAVEPLIASLKDPDLGIRRNAAGVLGDINDPRAADVLLPALRERNLGVIAATYPFFIKRAEPGSEEVLVQSLNAQGDTVMAGAFLNCGNPRLEAAARVWAAANGIRIVPAIIAGGGGLRWGGRR
jgi:HEAT repeat protein